MHVEVKGKSVLKTEVVKIYGLGSPFLQWCIVLESKVLVWRSIEDKKKSPEKSVGNLQLSTVGELNCNVPAPSLFNPWRRCRRLMEHRYIDHDSVGPSLGQPGAAYSGWVHFLRCSVKQCIKTAGAVLELTVATKFLDVLFIVWNKTK